MICPGLASTFAAYSSGPSDSPFVKLPKPTMTSPSLMDELGSKELIARLPTHRDQALVPVKIMFGSAFLSAKFVLGWIELFWRHCL